VKRRKSTLCQGVRVSTAGGEEKEEKGSEPVVNGSAVVVYEERKGASQYFLLCSRQGNRQEREGEGRKLSAQFPTNQAAVAHAIKLQRTSKPKTPGCPRLCCGSKQDRKREGERKVSYTRRRREGERSERDGRGERQRSVCVKREREEGGWNCR
jgi:hypothetical protein